MHLATQGIISWRQAADMMGISFRHCCRLKRSWQQHGFSALMDQRGRVPRRKRIKPEVIQAICKLRQGRYREFSVKHFYEHARLEETYGVSYSYVLRMLQDVSLAPAAEGKGRYHRKRERKAMRGMMVHLDASRHHWLGRQHPAWDLLVALDDADGCILYAKFVREEDTLSCIAAIEHIVRAKGRFSSLYTDRGSHFCRTSKKGDKPDSEQNGQIHRICTELGIRHIKAMTPQARGRSERAFGTMQGRLPQELALAKIKSYEKANRYLEQTFVPAFNERFGVQPALPCSAYVPLDESHDLELLFSAWYERKVACDHTVRFAGQKLIIAKSAHRYSFAKCKVTVHQFPDGHLAISHLAKVLGQYTPAGHLISTKTNKKRRAA